MISTIHFRKVILVMAVIFLSACNHVKHETNQSNLERLERLDSSIRDSKNPEGFMNHYATVFVRTQGEKVIYNEGDESMSPTITYPGQDPVCFYELKGDTFKRFTNVNEVVNFMASRGWKLKSLNNSMHGSEDVFWMTFETIANWSLGVNQEWNIKQTVPTTVSFARRERKPSLAERPEAGLRSPGKNHCVTKL